MAKRTLWSRLTSTSRARATRAGVTQIGYVNGAWVPWQRGVQKPVTKAQQARQRALNRIGFTPSELSNWPARTRITLQDAVNDGNDLSWLREIPKTLRAQAFRYWVEYRQRPPQDEVDAYKRTEAWKKRVHDKEVNKYFAQHQNITDPALPPHMFQDAAMLSNDTFRHARFYSTIDANSHVMPIRPPVWWFWYH